MLTEKDVILHAKSYYMETYYMLMHWKTMRIAEN